VNDREQGLKRARYGTGRDRLLAAAQEVFAAKGHAGSARDIAERAGITEAMVFRHFGTKTALFEEAALEPVVAFIDGYVAEWEARPHGRRSPEAELREFFTRLLGVLSAERELLLAVLAAGHFHADLAPAARRLEQAFERVLELIEGMLAEELVVRGLRTEHRPALARILVGLTISFALTPDWLLIGEAPGEVPAADVIAEAARVIVHGLTTT
jgi:AcrR family transcriptional regulator